MDFGVKLPERYGPASQTPTRPSRLPNLLGRKRAADQGGQAVVEFALVLPVLMLVILGIFKFGILFNNYLTLTDAVRSGARQLAIERGQLSPCTDTVTTIQQAGSSLNTANMAITITITSPLDGTTSVYTQPPVTGMTTCGTLGAGTPATVSATYPCDTTIFGIQFVPNCKLTAQATEEVE